MAEVQQTATTAKNPYAPNPYRSKFKAIIAEMRRKKEDPQFIRYVMDQEGYDVSLVDQELANLQSYDSGEPIQPAKVDVNALPGDKLDQTQLTATQSTALLYGQRMYQSGKILDALDEGIANKDFLGSVKQRIDESNVGGTVTGQFVGEDFKKFDQAKRDFINASLRRESGAVISPQEFENADKQYFPVPGDSKDVLAQKKANREVQAKGFLKSAGVTDAEINFNSQEATVQPTQSSGQLDQAKAWLEANPTDPRAEKVKAKIAQMETTSTNVGLNVSEQPSGTGTDFTAMGGDAGQAVGGFLGGNKIGEAIGEVVGGVMSKYGEAGKTFQKTLTELAQAKADGKLTEEKYNSLVDMQEKAAKDAFGYAGPSFRQVAGDAAKVALTVLGGAEVKGATWLATAGRSALWGAGYGAANAQAEGKGLKDTAVDAAIGAVLGAVIPVAGKVVSKGFKAVVGKNTPAEALGEILQGKTKDLSAGQRVFAVLDTKGVDTFDALGQKLDEFVGATSQKVDEVLGQSKKIFTPQELVTTGTTTGGKTVKTNFVTSAIKQLQDFYTQAGDNVMAGNFGELLQKAQSEGLSSLEVNQLARHYGIDFGDKAFNKLGDPLSSVSAQMYENVRKGLKEVARRGVTGSEAKALDSLIGDSIAVRNLVRKNIEAVNRLEQKASKMGIGEKIVRGASKLADVATLGGFSGFRKLFIQSNVGLKTMNYLDIESHLAGNLKILQSALKEANPGKFEALIKKFNRSMIEKAKSVRPGMSTQSVLDNPQIKQLDSHIRTIQEKLNSTTSKVARKGYEKEIAKYTEEINQRIKNLGSPAMGKIAKSESPLLQEAGKYKSAEEFVFNTKTLFRGTNDEGANLLKAGHIPREGLSVTLDPSVAKKYAASRGLAGYTIEKNLIPGAKVISLEDVPNTVRSSGEGTDFAGKAAIWARKQGYDVLDMSKGNEGEMRILNKDVLKTKSQLTDLYNKAQGVKKKINKNKAQLEALRKLKKKD